MQKITNIEIKNFKSIRHQKIEDCRRVNVFIGYPNVGKSNTLEALGLFSLTQLYNHNEDFTLRSICRYNHLSDLNFDKNVKNGVHIGINNIYEVYFEKSDPDYDFKLRIDSLNKGRMPLFTIEADESTNLNLISPSEMLDTENDIIYKIKYYTFDKNTEYNKSKYLSLSIPYGDNLFDIFQGNGDLRKEIAGLFEEYNLTLFLDGEEIKFLKYFSEGTGISFGYHLIADTLKRLIFYKTAIHTNKDSVLLFEEPEAHMFPPYISKFTSDIMNDEKDNQFFITTHSPFVLNDFMEQLDKSELSIYLVDIKNGETIVRKMSDDEMHEAYQFGYDFFLNLKNFTRAD